jgi:hypothetical protein
MASAKAISPRLARSGGDMTGLIAFDRTDRKSEVGAKPSRVSEPEARSVSIEVQCGVRGPAKT